MKYYDQVSVASRTKQTAYFVQQHDKNKMMSKLLATFPHKQKVVIVKSKKNADELMKYLNTQEITALSIHGNHRASQIKDAQKSFNTKEIDILITTDKIFETMTLEDTQVMFSYDLPIVASDYFKRLLLVDEIGESISLISPEDEKMLINIELLMRCEMDVLKLENFEHTDKKPSIIKDKIKKPRHKKVEQRAKRKAEIKSKWVPNKKESTT